MVTPLTHKSSRFAPHRSSQTALLHKSSRWLGQARRMSASSWSNRKYRTRNWQEYKRALKARGSLTVWCETGMQWHAPQSGKRGRNRCYSDAAIQCCLGFKVLFHLALRQTIGLFESLIKICALPWKTPNFSTLCRRQKNVDVRVQYTASSGALHLLIDSTGMKFLGEGVNGARSISAWVSATCRYGLL